jgi:hypothetical protein
MQLTDLPHDVLCHVMKLADQPSRLAAMGACGRLRDAAGAPGVWTEVTMRDLGRSALDFMERHQCPVLRVVSTCPDDAAWFFRKLAAAGVACIRDLTVHLGVVQRVPSSLLRGVGSLPGLRRLKIVVDDLDMTSDLFFHQTHQLHDLESLEIVERSSGTKQLNVWFEGTHRRFRNLTTLALDVGLSDVVEGMRHMTKLRRVVYHFEEDENEETYEDAQFEGLDLEYLELDLASDDAGATREALFEQLQQCSVRQLVLHVKDGWLDLSRPMSPAMESLVLRMHVTHGTINLDFPILRRHDRLRSLTLNIGAPWISQDPVLDRSCKHTLSFNRVPRLDDWLEFARGLELTKHPTTCITVCPS